MPLKEKAICNRIVLLVHGVGTALREVYAFRKVK